jgi:hypothetical protein
VTEFYGVNPEWAEIARQAEEALRAYRNVEPALSYAREVLGLDEGAVAGLAEMAMQYALPFVRVLVTAHPGTATSVGSAVVMAKGTVAATGRVTAPTLPAQFTALPCGQRLVLIVIALSVLLSLGLSPEARDELVFLITVLSAAIWVGSKVIKS